MKKLLVALFLVSPFVIADPMQPAPMPPSQPAPLQQPPALPQQPPAPYQQPPTSQGDQMRLTENDLRMFSNSPTRQPSSLPSSLPPFPMPGDVYTEKKQTVFVNVYGEFTIEGVSYAVTDMGVMHVRGKEVFCSYSVCYKINEDKSKKTEKKGR